MSDLAIRARGLGKRYAIGGPPRSADSLRELVMDSVRALGGRSRPAAPEPENFIWALRDVSFDLKHGEVLGLIGDNGAGKSTLLKILARITEPTEGEVEIHGRVGSLLEVGTGFHPDLTGRENIMLSGALLGMRRLEILRKFDEIVEFSGVRTFIDTPVKRYSSGMFMRLAFAVAAHLETEVVLVDEVLAVGDVEFQKKCLGKMGDVARQGRTVVFVSHNLGAVQRLCPASMLFEKGRIATSGPTTQVVQRYLRTVHEAALDWRRPAAPDADAYFERVFVADAEGDPVTSVATGDRIRVGMQLVVRRAPRDLQLSIGLRDAQSGEWIFASSPQDSGVAPPAEPARYQAFVELPRDVLMEREYAIRTVLWTPHVGTVDVLDVLSFTATSSPSLGNSTPGGRVGLIALRCAWTLEPAEAGMPVAMETTSG